MSNDDLLNELAKIRERRKKIKRSSYSKTASKLDPYRDEILFLYQHDASPEDIQIWLRKRRCSALEFINAFDLNSVVYLTLYS